MAKVRKKKRKPGKDGGPSPDPTPEEKEQGERFFLTLGVVFVAIVVIFVLLELAR